MVLVSIVQSKTIPDAYQSGFLEGTTPMYDSYIKLKKSLIQFHKEEV